MTAVLWNVKAKNVNTRNGINFLLKTYGNEKIQITIAIYCLIINNEKNDDNINRTALSSKLPVAYLCNKKIQPDERTTA